MPTALSRVGTGVPTMCLMPTTRRPDRPFRLYGTRQRPHLEGASADPDFDHVEDDYSRPKMATHRIAEIQGRTSRCGGARGGADRTRTFHNPRLLPEKTFPRISRDLRELAGQRRHRVPAPHPVGRAEPARRPRFRNRTSEQGFPRRLRRRPILIATIYGMRDTEPVALETARSFRTRPHDRLPRVVLPSAARRRWSPTCTPPGCGPVPGQGTGNRVSAAKKIVTRAIMDTRTTVTVISIRTWRRRSGVRGQAGAAARPAR